jgi:hypothetical protein
MRKAMLLVVLVLPWPLSVAEAAPAPLPKPEAHSEAAFDARTPERARAVAAFLRSPYFARWARLDGAWLKANLSVEQDGALVRVRLRGVRSLSQLEALGGALTFEKKDDGGTEDIQREVRYLKMLLLVEESREDSRRREEIMRGWSLVEGKTLKVHTAPRSVRVRR